MEGGFIEHKSTGSIMRHRVVVFYKLTNSKILLNVNTFAVLHNDVFEFVLLCEAVE